MADFWPPRRAEIGQKQTSVSYSNQPLAAMNKVATNDLEQSWVLFVNQMTNLAKF